MIDRIQSLLILNGIDLDDEYYSIYAERASGHTRLFLDASGEYLVRLERMEGELVALTVFQELIWVQRVSPEVRNAWSANTIRIERKPGAILNNVEIEYGRKTRNLLVKAVGNESAWQQFIGMLNSQIAESEADQTKVRT